MRDLRVDRRAAIGGGVVLALLAGVPLAVLRSQAAHANDVTDRQRSMAAQVAQHLIPRTDTPGGADVGADAFLIVALAHGLDGTRVPSSGGAVQGATDFYRRQDGSLDHLRWLEDMLDAKSGGDFVGAPASAQIAAIEAVDAPAFAQPGGDSPWTHIKGLLLTGYYTSEIGGSKELRYELVPGRFDPDIPLGPQDRAWSSDWTAVEFG